MLEDEGAPDRVVFHCFSGDAAMARALRRARLVPVVRRHRDVQERRRRCARRCAVAPLDRLLVETDAPFLTPMPYRGRPNASYLIPLTVRAMAAVKGVDRGRRWRAAVAANTERAFDPW